MPPAHVSVSSINGAKDHGVSDAAPVITLSVGDYDAVLFDLDGVLTKTASVHAVAWKKLFDEFLKQRSAATGEPFVPFDIEADYRGHVDGKPRLDGVAAFLESRGIELPRGGPEDPPNAQTVYALGTCKDEYFLQQLQAHGVEVYHASIALVRRLRELGIKTAVVSSSNNCAALLEAAGIAKLFDARVDGLDLTRHALKGKPAPDTFLEAARRLDVEPARAVVVEDAVAGVEAGRAGGFGFVIGIDRGGNSKLPQEIDRLSMRIRYRGHSLHLRVTRDALTVRGTDRGPAPIRLGINNQVYDFAGGSIRVFPLR